MTNTTLRKKSDAGNPRKLIVIKCLTFATASMLVSMASAFEWAQDLVVEKGESVTLGTEYKNSVNTSMTLHGNLTIRMEKNNNMYYVNALDGTTRLATDVRIAIGPESGDDATLEVRLADLNSTVVNSMYANAVIGENGGNGRLWLNHSAAYEYAYAHVKSFTLSANATTTANSFDAVQLGYYSQLYASSICNQNVKPMRIIFDGETGLCGSGYYSSITAGNGAKLFSLPTAGGNVVLVGNNEYAPLAIRSWSGWSWTLFDGTPTANLVFQGPSDVRFEVGVNAATTINGSKIIWNNTGDLVLYPSGAKDGKIATLNTTAANWMPYGSQTGYVCVDKIGAGESGSVKVDLKGYSQRVNGIIVKGNSMITNSSTTTATMSVGDENGNGLLAGTFTDEKIRWVKNGADGVLVLSNATLHALCVMGGVIRLAPNTVNAIGRLAITNALVESSETATLSVATWETGEGVRLGYVLETVGGVSNEVVTTFPVVADTTLYKEGAYQLYCVTPADAQGMAVDVRGGTLKMGGEVTANKYWRMTFKKAMAATYTYSDAADGYSKDVNLILGGIGLFSANGLHVLPDTMTKTADGTAASALAQHTAASEKSTYSMNAAIYKELYPQSKRTFDPICGGGDASVGVRASLSVGNATRLSTNMWDVVGTNTATSWFNWPSGTIFANGALDPNDSSTWERIVWRLDDSAKPCATYALSRFVNNDDKDRPHPTNWMLESSPDGETWQTMDERSGQTFTTSPLSAQFNYTYNDHVPYLFAENRANWTFNTFGTVSVAAGATLDLAEIPTYNIAIAGLSIDMTAGAGTINRFVPAQNGTLELTNVTASDLAKKKITLPITLTDVSGAELLDTWTATANGVPIPNSRVILKGGKLCVKRTTGFVLFFR